MVRISAWLRATAVVCFFTLMLSGAGQEPIREILSSYQFKSVNTQQLDAVAAQFEIIDRDGDTFDVLVPVEQKQVFLHLVPAAKLIEADIHASRLAQEKSNPDYFAGYHTYDQVKGLIEQIAESRPDIARLETYGTSQGGRPLVALKVSDNVQIDEDEPELLLTSATHGDEIITVEVLLSLLQEMIAGYGTNERLTNMINKSEIYFVMAVNPDGYASRSRYANGVDPNRDYPWPETPNRTSNSCITAIMDFFHAHNFAGSIDFHASGKLIMYPWAWTSQAPEAADLQKFSTLGQKMGQANRYEVGQISRIIYVAKGSSADYYYWKTGSLSYGIELATSKAPPSSSIPSVVNEARDMTWKFIENFTE